MIKIEHGIPIPRKRTGGPLYPWDDMNVGDSFFVEATDAKSKRNSIVSSAHKFRPRKFATRIVEGGVRVWRIL